MKRIPLFLSLLALASAAPAADPAPERLPDAVIVLSGTNQVGSALSALRSLTGTPDLAEGAPHPRRLATRLTDKAGLTLADRPMVFLSWLPKGMTEAPSPEAAMFFMKHSEDEPGQLMILPVEEKDSGDNPGMVVRAKDAAFHRNGWLYVAEGPEARAFAESCGDDPREALGLYLRVVGLSESPVAAILHEPGRFANLRDGMLAERREFHARLDDLRARDAAGEDVGDALEWTEHMAVHARFEEAIGDLFFSLIGDYDMAVVMLDCDESNGFSLGRILVSRSKADRFQSPIKGPGRTNVRLRRFLSDNLPFLAFPDLEDAAWQQARQIVRFSSATPDGNFDTWEIPPEAVRTIAHSFQAFLEHPEETHAEPPPPEPTPETPKDDIDGDGLADKAESYKYRTDPNNPDTDGDGLTDGAEVLKHRTDPCNPDTDADGLRDGDDVDEYRTDPLNPDTDGDGLTDGAEVLKHKTDPLDPATQSPAVVSDGIAD